MLSRGCRRSDAGIAAADAVNIPLAGTIPQLVFVAFQLMFAIITVALISGAVADRLKFGALAGVRRPVGDVRLLPGRALGVRVRRRSPVRHGGWIANKLKAIDFAGGTAVHINAGAAGLALAIVLGKRKGWPTHADAAAQPAVRDARRRPAVVRLVRVQRRFGAGRRAASPASTFVTTTVATGAAMLAWLLVEQIRDGHATTLGAASGIVAGLVAITPVLLVGQRARRAGHRLRRRCDLCAGRRPEVQVRLRRLARRGRRAPGRWPHRHLADRLPRGTGGARGVDGLVLRRRIRSAVAPGSRCRSRFCAYSFIVTTILALILKYTIGLRLDEEDEVDGIDEAEHAETGYDFATVGGGSSVLGRHGSEE